MKSGAHTTDKKHPELPEFIKITMMTGKYYLTFCAKAIPLMYFFFVHFPTRKTDHLKNIKNQ